MGNNVPVPSTQTVYNYDALGNRTTVVKDGVVTTYTVNAMNEYALISGGQGDSLSYDSRGNLATIDGYNFEYDYENRLNSIHGSHEIAIKYDALGRRIRKDSAGIFINSYYIETRLIAEGDEEYIEGISLDEGLIRVKNFEYIYVYNNEIQSAVVTIKSSTIIERYEYDPFGVFTTLSPNFESQGNDSNQYEILFAGGRQVSKSYYEYQNRWYSAGLGRFMQRDPINEILLYEKFKIFIHYYFNKIISLNTYSYVDNNPTSWLDAIGLFKYKPPGRNTPGSGDPVDPETKWGIKCFEECMHQNLECLGQELVVTGAKEGNHSIGSKHEKGRACDFGFRSNPCLNRRIAQECFDPCFGSGYGQQEKDHFHFQPDPGRRGSTGFAPGVR